jgi:hypothetical protein
MGCSFCYLVLCCMDFFIYTDLAVDDLPRAENSTGGREESTIPNVPWFLEETVLYWQCC